MSEINVSLMGRAELEQTAADLGIEFRKNISDAKLADRVREALGIPASPEIVDGPDMTTPADTGEKHYYITIATDSKDKQPVQVGVNGRMWVIQRGAKVKVPASVVGVLENAVQTPMDPQTMEKMNIQAYPFQVHGEA
ncbi:hypothetical protein [Spiribacter onubensis]|uniref:Uncharacterized protein n=1 Tax=Spiribacter onubensis TaxID=3122420 RepID=A0ABV3S754_9GAMM